MKNNIEGKVIVTTGASRGLGEAAAKHLSEEGERLPLSPAQYSFSLSSLSLN
jgi:NADP-dependent 3-hydroxy acid dehydrogenase YdfG